MSSKNDHPLDVEFSEKAKDSESSSNSAKDDEEPDLPKVSIKKLFRFATPLDLAMIFVGIAVSLGTGAALPLMSILTGKVSQDFVDKQADLNGVWNITHPNGPPFDEKHFEHDVMTVVYFYAGMTVGVFIIANVQVTCFLIACERMSDKLRRTAFGRSADAH